METRITPERKLRASFTYDARYSYGRSEYVRIRYRPTGVKVDKVRAADRDLYRRMADLCGLNGPSRRRAAIAESGATGDIPHAFTVLGSEWVVWYGDNWEAGTETVWTAAELRAVYMPTVKVKRPGKAEVLAAARQLAAMIEDVPDDIARVLAAA